MSDATDVLHAIDQLRRDLSGYHGQLKAHNDLQRHCDSQRKRIGELEGLYAKAKEEIAGLRELVQDYDRMLASMNALCDCDFVPLNDAVLLGLRSRMYKLGIEVE